jgi:dienelactone hydrolase
MTFRATSTVLASIVLIAALVTTASSQEPVSALDYLAQRADQLTGTWPPLPGAADVWPAYQAETIGRLSSLLNLPDREPMKAAVTGTTEQGDVVREQVEYLWAGQTYVSATVIRSKLAAGRQTAVVMPSGFLGHYTFAPHCQFVDALARNGALVIFIDDPRTGRRQSPYAGLYATASAAGTQVVGIQVFDALRALDYLVTRADVDPGKIGIAGVEEGVVQAYLAAALEPRFQFAIAVGGTTTYQDLARAAAKHQGPNDPSTFVAGLLGFADVDRIAACLAPRPIVLAGRSASPDGQARVLETVKSVYRLLGAEDRVQEVRGDLTDDPQRTMDDTMECFRKHVLPSLHSSSAAPMACDAPENPDFSMLHHMQRRIDQLAKSLPLPPASLPAWQDYRRQMIEWLATSCALSAVQPPADQTVSVSESNGVVTEQLLLGVDRNFCCPALLVHPAAPNAAPYTAVVLSPGDRQSASSEKIADAARRLAAGGLWVMVPDHASVEAHSRQPLGNVAKPRFRGDEAAGFYGPADLVGLPPLALRVLEDLAAVRHLAGRRDGAASDILLAGQGTGGVDACLAAVLNERVAGVISIDATTFRSWAKDAAPEQLHFFHIMPYLPSLLTKTDLDCLSAAIAPRPLIVIRPKDGWSRDGFDQVAATAASVYGLQQAESAFRALSWRDVTPEFIAGLPDGTVKQLISAAQPLLPVPPQPGTVGTVDGLRSRSAVDGAAGLICVVAEIAGGEQEFTGGPRTLQAWGFFNDDGNAAKGRTVTPLILKKQDSQYELVAIGTPRANAGTGAQSFAFEPVAGSALVGPGDYFGWYTGDLQGHPNAGVIEFDEAADALMILLTADGQMVDQVPRLGATYREQSRYRRCYSITATSQSQ